MGRVAEVVRWTCDANCDVEGDGVGERLPREWKGYTSGRRRFSDVDENLIVLCPEHAIHMDKILEERTEYYQKRKRKSLELFGHRSNIARRMVVLIACGDFYEGVAVIDGSTAVRVPEEEA